MNVLSAGLAHTLILSDKGELYSLGSSEHYQVIRDLRRRSQHLFDHGALRRGRAFRTDRGAETHDRRGAFWKKQV